MNDLLLEIGTEELPAGFIPPVLAQLKDMAVKEFSASRIERGEIFTYATPRRLVLYVKNVSDKQPDLEKEVKGPPGKAAYDNQGNPTKAAIGFAKSQGIDVKELYLKPLAQGEYIHAMIREKGKDALQVIAEVLPGIVKKLYFPKNMQWDDSGLKFTRPVRWILCILGSQVVPFTIGRLAAGNITFGHRVLGKGPFTVSSCDNYFEIMEHNGVILKHDERRKLIEEQAGKLTEEIKGNIIQFEPLIDEVNFLVEYPTSFLGSFSPDYLTLPGEVLKTVMTKHQRYFTLGDKDGNIIPYFIGVRNGDTRGIDIVKTGNERVIDARFADAKYFFEEDKKVPLDIYLDKLKYIGFQKNLGNMYEKMERMRKLSKIIISLIGKSDLGKDVDRASHLCKADLASHMVIEFPELQGIMGGIYASLREREAVAKAIRHHYKPAFAQDELPPTIEGQIVSLADKFDSLVGCYGAGYVPTGSADPYGVRRSALGVIRLLLHGDLKIDITVLFDKAFDLYLEAGFKLRDKETAKPEFEEFLFQRVENYLIGNGYRYDVVKSVKRGALKDLKDTLARIEAITKIRDEAEFLILVAAFTRAYNILKKYFEGEAVFSNALLIDDAEKKLYEGYLKFEKGNKSYEEIMKDLSALRPAIDFFFDKVMVMVPETEIKNNRLALLDMIVKLYLDVADFSEIVIEGN